LDEVEAFGRTLKQAVHPLPDHRRIRMLGKSVQVYLPLAQPDRIMTAPNLVAALQASFGWSGRPRRLDSLRYSRGSG